MDESNAEIKTYCMENNIRDSDTLKLHALV